MPQPDQRQGTLPSVSTEKRRKPYPRMLRSAVPEGFFLAECVGTVAHPRVRVCDGQSLPPLYCHCPEPPRKLGTLYACRLRPSKGRKGGAFYFARDLHEVTDG